MSILFNKQPQILNVELAELIGLNEAIVLQQVHYWIDINKKAGKNLRKGRFWTYNTFEQWQENNFSYWSVITVKRIFKKLEDKNLLLTDNFNQKGFDRTKWYTVNYEKLEALKNAESLENTHNIKMIQSDTKGTLEEFKKNNKNAESLENTHNIKMIQSTYQSDTMDNIKMIRPIPEIKKEINNREYEESSHSQVKSIEKEKNIKKDMTGQGHDKTINQATELENLKHEKEILEQKKEIEELKAQLKELKESKEEKKETAITDLHKYEFYKELIQKNVKYDWITSHHKEKRDFLELVNTFIDIMAETMASNKKYIKINQEDIGQAFLSKKFEMITDNHLFFAIRQYQEYAQQTKIKFPKNYILTCLFNATTEATPKDYTFS